MENDTLKSGYVSHRYIDDGKLSNAQLIGLIAMFSTLIISITLISIMNKRKRRIKDINDEAFIRNIFSTFILFSP